MRYDTAIFDLDGTLLDTLCDLCDGVNAAMRYAGSPARSLDEVRCALGHGSYHLIRECLPPGTDETQVRRVLDFYLPYYEAHAAIKTAPYPGVPDMLRALRSRGVRTAVVSNKQDGAVKRLTERYFPGLLDVSVGVTEGVEPKPAPDALLAVMRALRARPESTVYIGDSDVDIDTAKNAGIDCISVTWGFRDESLLASRGASRLASDAASLEKMILSADARMP